MLVQALSDSAPVLPLRADGTDKVLQGGLAQRKEASWHTGALLFRTGDPAEGVYGLCGTQACAMGEV